MNIAVEHLQAQTKRKRRLRVLGLTLLLVASLVGGIASVIFHWHDRAYYYFTSMVDANQWEGRSLWLSDYQVEIEAKPIAGIDDDLSGIDYDFDHNRLLAVTNGAPTKIVALNREGETTATYPLKGFEDVEGLAYMGDGMVVVTEENEQQLVFFRLPDQSGEAIDKKLSQSLALGINLSPHNKGFEGVTYDRANDRLFVAKEREPRQIFEISGVLAALNGRLQIKILDLTEWVNRSVFAKDISDVHYDLRTGHLLVLSHESRLVIELSNSGEMVSFRTLLGRFSDLEETAEQAEGLTIDDEGELYIVSEPNLFYRFRKN